MEEWKEINGFCGLFEISNLGKVRVKDREYINNLGRLRKIKSHLLYQSTTGSGYKSVQIYFKGKMKAYMVHRLVAEYFVPNPFGYKEVNHKDENKCNNIADNLEWCSRSYNCKYGNGLKVRSKECSKPVIQILGGIFINEYPSMISAERATGIKAGGISKCCNGKSKTAGGYQWKLK